MHLYAQMTLTKLTRVLAALRPLQRPGALFCLWHAALACMFHSGGLDKLIPCHANVHACKISTPHVRFCFQASMTMSVQAFANNWGEAVLPAAAAVWHQCLV